MQAKDRKIGRVMLIRNSGVAVLAVAGWPKTLVVDVGTPFT